MIQTPFYSSSSIRRYWFNWSLVDLCETVGNIRNEGHTVTGMHARPFFYSIYLNDSVTDNATNTNENRQDLYYRCLWLTLAVVAVPAIVVAVWWWLWRRG